MYFCCDSKSLLQVLAVAVAEIIIYRRPSVVIHRDSTLGISLFDKDNGCSQMRILRHRLPVCFSESGKCECCKNRIDGNGLYPESALIVVLVDEFVTHGRLRNSAPGIDHPVEDPYDGRSGMECKISANLSTGVRKLRFQKKNRRIDGTSGNDDDGSFNNEVGFCFARRPVKDKP